MRTFIFDTETTDLVQNSMLPEKLQPHIIEFYGQVLDEDFNVVNEIEFFCKPPVELTAEITRITGITKEMLKDADPFSRNEWKVRKALADCDELVAHNLSFDTAMLRFEFERCKLLQTVKWPQVLICTVEQTEWIKGHRLSLSALHEHLFGEPFTGAHRARVDVQALTRCFVELRKRGDV